MYYSVYLAMARVPQMLPTHCHLRLTFIDAVVHAQEKLIEEFGAEEFHARKEEASWASS